MTGTADREGIDMTEPTGEGVSTKTPPPTAAIEAVSRAAAEYGIGVEYQVARTIAEAALASYETTVGYRTQMTQQVWAIPEARKHMIEGVHHQLISEALSKGYVPAALPKETLRYYVEPWMEGTEVPAEVAERDPSSWLSVIIMFTMPVRYAP